MDNRGALNAVSSGRAALTGSALYCIGATGQLLEHHRGRTAFGSVGFTCDQVLLSGGVESVGVVLGSRSRIR